MEKKKLGLPRLQLKILLSLLLAIVLLQSTSSVILYFSTQSEIIAKRNEDMKGIISSFAESFNNPQYIQYSSVTKKAYSLIYPKYHNHTDEMAPGSVMLAHYLAEFEEQEQAISGASMSRYGTPKAMILNAIIAMGTPSYSKFLAYGYIDEATNNFVVIAGNYDQSTYGVSTARSHVATSGYFYQWSVYEQYIDPNTNSFIGVEIHDAVKGDVYVSAKKIEDDNNSGLWIITETDRSYFTNQMSRFMMVFMWSSLVMAAVVFVSLFFLIQFIFTRRLNRLNALTHTAVEDIKGGRFGEHFMLSEDKGLKRDELTYLNDSLYFLEGELKNYVDNFRNAVSKEEKAKAELMLSSQIQLSSLPSTSVDDLNISLCPIIKLAKEVGGDFYDYFYVDDHRFVFIIGDVSGKGVPAALFMMKGKSMLRAYLSGDFDLAEKVSMINTELCKDNSMSLFITSFIGLMDINTNILTFVNCGHEEVYVKQGPLFEMINEETNLPLGVMGGMEYVSQQIKLQPGDRFFLYTDGVSEAEDINGNFFGKERIGESLNKARHLPGELLLKHMMSIVDAYQEGKEQADDICMISFDYRLPWICLKNDTEELRRVDPFVDGVASRIDNPTAISELRIALDELVTNVIRYAYDGEGQFYLCLYQNERHGTIVGYLVDNGKPFNPLDSKPNENIQEVAGGLGILMAKDALDTLEYQRIADYNVLLMIKSYK